MEKRNKRIVFILIVLLALLFTDAPAAWSADLTPFGKSGKTGVGDGTAFPVFELPMPGSEREKGYLGLSGTGNFTLGQVKAQVLIVEVYSFYCPFCQREAASVNELYQKIEERPDLKGKIKIIGIAVTNSEYEVNSYRERYKVPFPLIPDANMEISQKFGAKATPTFIGVRINGKEGLQKFYFEEGSIGDAGPFLQKIVKLSGLK